MKEESICACYGLIIAGCGAMIVSLFLSFFTLGALGMVSAFIGIILITILDKDNSDPNDIKSPSDLMRDN